MDRRGGGCYSRCRGGVPFGYFVSQKSVDPRRPRVTAGFIPVRRGGLHAALLVQTPDATFTADPAKPLAVKFMNANPKSSGKARIGICW